jgi:hypothetical protein
VKPLYCKLILLIGLATIMFGGVFVTAAFGQVETGTINGTVTDPSGAVVPKVKVAVTNTATAATRIVETDTGGFYSVPNLPPGVYSVSFEAASFAKLEKQAEVVPGARVSLNVQLTVGPTTATVEVVASGPPCQHP